MKNIYDKLRESNLNPYFIGQHKGLCVEPCVIVKKGNQIPAINSRMVGQQVIDIIIMVPESSYIELEFYAKDVRSVLKEIKYLRKTGTETPAVTDDEKKAYTMSIEYVLQKKLEG